MATGNVSALDRDTWQLIETKTSLGGSSINFTGLAGAYKNLMMTWNILTGNSYLTLRINEETGDFYSGCCFTTDGLGATNQTKTQFWLANSTGTQNIGYVVLTNCDLDTMPKIVTNGWNTTGGGPFGGTYYGSGTVTSLQLQNSGGSINSGTISLFGQAI
jgi:hypothetical protein